MAWYTEPMKAAILSLLVLLSPLIVALPPQAGAQTTVPPPTPRGAEPSAQFIAEIRAQLAADPKSAQMTSYQLDMFARQVATQIVQSSNAPKGSIATSSPQAPAQGKPPDDATSAGGGLANCFSYYHFGSVQAKLDANVQSTIAGGPVTFSGVLENSNPYPVVDGTLYVKIFRYPKGTFDTRNGPDVVDQFIAIDGISIPANGAVPASFSWKIPAYAVSGDYAAAMFYTTEHKFNLLGLTFTDDVTGNTARFKVSGEQQSAVGFVKNAVTVGGAAYHFAEFPPHASSTGNVIVAAKLANTGAEAQPVSVHWQLYSWDAQLPGNLIAESNVSVNVPAGGSTPVTYVITDTSVPVYLLVGTATWRDTKSVIGVRVVRDGINKLRINFPSTALYPLQGGKENTIFSCFHNTSDGVVQDARLDLRLIDAKGKEIEAFSYTGAAGGNMLAYAKKFTPKKSYQTFSLEAKLYQDGELVDETTVHYDCKLIDPNSCPRTDYRMVALVGGLAVLLILGYALWRRHTAAAPTA